MYITEFSVLLWMAEWLRKPQHKCKGKLCVHLQGKSKSTDKGKLLKAKYKNTNFLEAKYKTVCICIIYIVVCVYVCVCIHMQLQL